MNLVSEQIIARLECYRDYSTFVLRNYKFKKPSGLNFKFNHDSIRIKLKRDTFISIEGYDIYLIDTIIQSERGAIRVPKEKITTFTSTNGAIEWVKRLLAKPQIAFNIIASKKDPVIPCRVYLPNDNGTKKFLKTANGKRVNAIHASQIDEFRSEGIIIETGSKAEELTMKVGAKKKVLSYNRSKTNNKHSSVTQRFHP